MYENYTDEQLLTLVIWREARGESLDGKIAVGCSIRNRVNHPCWWGHDYHSVILKPWQYSSFNSNDPNSSKFPSESDSSYSDSLAAAQAVLAGKEDTTSGATSYFDRSLDSHPPKWAMDGSNKLTVTIGRLHFYRLV